jgi:hypothetical protein
MKRTLAAAVLALLLLAACHPSPRFADPGPAGQDLVNQAAERVYRMRAESHAHALDIYFAEAQGVGAAIGLVPAFIERGMIAGNDIAVFTAIGMCWSGFLSTHTAMLDALGYRQLTSRAIVSHTIAGACAGIFAHYLYLGLAMAFGW